MTVETASLPAALVPPKKRDFSEYPAIASSPEMEDHHHQAPTSPPPTPDARSRTSPVHQLPSSVGGGGGQGYKSEPLLKSSGFMITDILSPPASVAIPGGLRIEGFAAAHHLGRVPSPHADRDSSDNGSYKENDLSDDGEGNSFFLILILMN